MKIICSRPHGHRWGINQNFGEEGISTGYFVIRLGFFKIDILWSKE